VYFIATEVVSFVNEVVLWFVIFFAFKYGVHFPVAAVLAPIQ
jgi:hypothetical protein